MKHRDKATERVFNREDKVDRIKSLLPT